MSADFFSQLRRLVGVEQEVKQLQEKVLQRPYDREDPPEGAAVLLLRGLQTDLQSTKMESRRQLSSLCDDKGFMTLVPFCESLLQHQMTALTAVQTHLSQYGYVPPPSNTDTGEPDSSGHMQNIPSTPGLSQGENNAQVSMTPASNAKHSRPKFDLDRTPTLEDFGLSENHMASILDRKNAVFKEPAPPNYDPSSHNFTEPPSSLKKWSSADSIPETFKNDMTIATTPGLFNGRHVPTVTPAEHRGGPSCRLGSFNSPAAPTPKQKLLSCLTSDDSDSGNYREDLSSPIPPTFTTPGARQLPKKLPGRQLPPRPPAFSPSEDSGPDSPAPPTLTTPGVKQLYRPDRGLGAKVENRLGVESGETSNDNSPAYPVFNTPGLNKIHTVITKDVVSSEDNTPEQPQFCTPHLQAKLTRPAQPEAQKSEWQTTDTTPESPELTFAIKGDPLRRDEPVPLKPRLVSRVSDDDDDMPGTPEMTFNFKSLAKSLHQVAPQVTKPTTGVTTHASVVKEAAEVNHKPMPIAPVIQPRTSCIDEDDDLPPEPEYTFNFTKQRAPKPEPVPTAPTLSQQKPHTEQQEEKAPESNEVVTQEEDEVPPGVPRLRPLISEEYVSQPSWVQRQLSFDMVEKAIHKLNALLVQKAKEGKALTVNDRDMGSVSLTYFLMNTKRVVVHRETSLGTTYSVLQLK